MGFPRPGGAGGGIDLSRINSDLSEPLNYLAWIQDLATFGESGYVYKSYAKIFELLSKSQNIYDNDVAYALILDKVFSEDANVGEFFEIVTGDTTGAFDGLTTMALVAASETAMTAVADSETAMTAVADSETAMTAIANSETACEAIRDSEIAITVLDNSNPILVPQMTSNTEPSGIASASSIYSVAGFEAWRAFDKLNTSWWITGAGIASNSWLGYEFQEDVWCYKIKINNSTQVPNAEMKNFKIQYSSDGTNWEDAITSIALQSSSEQIFNVASNSGKVKHWRIYAVDNYGHTYITLAELQFFCK